MGLFNLFSKRSTRRIKPYIEDSINKIYDLLFCDNMELYKSEPHSLIYPWDTLLSETPNINKPKEITVDTTLESRHRILAYFNEYK